jgi:hypothetical protein
VLWAQQPSNLRLLRTILLRGETHHVQGIEVAGSRLWVTSVDRAARRGLLFAYDLPAGSLLQTTEVHDAAKYHPGGISSDADSLWIPVAEYRPGGVTLIQRRRKSTLELIQHFTAGDHIGCLAVTAEHVIGANWDAREFYFWTHEGRLLRKARNPTDNAFQDLKISGRYLVGGGLLPDQSGALDWLELPSLRHVRRVRVGKSDRGVAYTHEGMALSGRDLYLLPEDSPSRLFVFRAPE